ncbi:protein of unknown function [endosymbiont DhMRE of Dentiscutata heterogama]|uniref:hypothetical protein n=1 Tax=endosymbiont DhMRE of Dentiscutata heterogama TaxID=1609546 RepID=UPI000629D8F6|nr:hypothetical protein [endosymbiont DhMRE of Dentiscutata heterogama]CFW93409.1 protein of unknown function [endosymbiont DhMRE of Dentiscutata heterogama]
MAQSKEELKQKYEEILQEIKIKEEKVETLWNLIDYGREKRAEWEANPDNENQPFDSRELNFWEDRRKELWAEVQKLEGEAYFIKTYQLKIEEEEVCPECGRKVEVDENTGVCKRCAKQIEEGLTLEEEEDEEGGNDDEDDEEEEIEEQECIECGNILETQAEIESGICEECTEKTEEENEKKECSDCGEELESEQEVKMGVCYDCTAKLIETEPECSECGETLITDEEIKRGICDNCNKKYGK